MTTRRKFLQTAAASPLICSPLVAAKPAQGSGGGSSGYLPNVMVETHDGRKVRFYDDLVRGRMVVFNMMYVNCANICPPNTANLLQVQQALGDRVGRDVFMYSITLQPDFDRPAALRDYMKQYGIGRGWTYLTGKREDIDLIRRRLGFFDPNPVIDADLKEHTGMLRIGHDARDRWSMVPSQATTRQIVNSIVNYL